MGTKNKEIEGQIESIRFRNTEGWSVFSVRETGGGVVNCTGTLATILDKGDDVVCTGKYITNNFGKQLKCGSIVPIPPDTNTESGVLKLLQRLPGIGLVKATSAIKKFGAKEAWDLAITDPVQIGVLPKSVDDAKEIAKGLVSTFDTITYLLGIGLTDNQAKKVMDRYRGDSKQVVSTEPYRLIKDIDGFGFITVDRIALKAGISVGNQARVTACIMYCLNDSSINGGNVYCHGKELVAIVLDQLTESAKKSEVSMFHAPEYQDVRSAVYFLEAEDLVVIEQGKVFSRELLNAEQYLEGVVAWA